MLNEILSRSPDVTARNTEQTLRFGLDQVDESKQILFVQQSEVKLHDRTVDPEHGAVRDSFRRELFLSTQRVAELGQGQAAGR